MFRRIDALAAGGVMLHGWNDHAEIHLGPTIGPAHPDALSPEHGYRWDVLHAHLDLESTKYRHLGRCIAGIGSYKPLRRRNQSEEDFVAELAAFEANREREAAASGFFIVPYPVAPEHWNAGDLELLIARFVSHLPRTSDGFWLRVTPHDYFTKRAPRYSWHIEASTHHWRAFLQIPCFPTIALVEWLQRERVKIELHTDWKRLEMLAAVPDPAPVTSPTSRPSRSLTVIKGKRDMPHG